MLRFEKKAKRDGYQLIIGVDEAGRGPLAGPVVASAVALRNYKFTSKIADSKKITARQREEAFHEIFNKAFVGVGIMSEAVIDRVNILEATYLAMHNAVNQLIAQVPHPQKEDGDFPEKVCLLIDGHRFKSDLPYFYQTVVKADESIMSVACASIVAKVIRDRILEIYDRIFPGYGFRKHKGYPTVQHKKAILKLGPSLIHRKSFHPHFEI